MTARYRITSYRITSPGLDHGIWPGGFPLEALAAMLRANGYDVTVNPLGGVSIPPGTRAAIGGLEAFTVEPVRCELEQGGLFA